MSVLLQDILISAGLRRPAKIDFMSVDTEAAEVEVSHIVEEDCK